MAVGLLAGAVTGCTRGPSPDDSPPTTTAPHPTGTTRGGVTVQSGVVYGTGQVGSPKAGSVPLRLDLYQPAGAFHRARPVIILIHGGGFTGQGRADPAIVRIARALARRHIAVASIDYRLQGQDPVPSRRVSALKASLSASSLRPAILAAVDDTLTAWDYLKAHAGPLHLDLDRLGLVGSSSGAITADHVGYALDDHHIDGPKVAFVASLWGGILVQAPLSVGSVAAAQAEAGSPDLFAVHGDDDQQVPVLLDDQLVAQARAVGSRVEYHRMPGGGDGFGPSHFFDGAVVGSQTPFDRLLLFAQAELT